MPISVTDQVTNSTVSFPDGTSPDVIKQRMAQFRQQQGGGASPWQQLISQPKDSAFFSQPGSELRPGEQIGSPPAPEGGYTGEVLPLRRDPQGGMHAAVPRMISDTWQALLKVGKAAAGEGPLPTLPEATGVATLMVPGAAAGRVGPMSAARSLMQDYAGAKIPFSAPLTGGRAAGVATQAARAVPFVGSAVEHAMTPIAAKTAGRATELAESIGTPRPPEQAGAAAQNALRQFAADKSTFEPEYKEYDRLMHGANPQQPINTAAALHQITARYGNQPEVEKKLKELLLDPTINRVGNLLDPRGAPFLSSQQMQHVRSKIGGLIEKPWFGPGGIARSDANQLYAALAKDLHDAAARRGPEAVRAWEKANRGFALHMASIERLESLIKAPRDEMVYSRLNQAAMETRTGGGDSQLLRTAKRVLPAEEWNNLGASILARMGKPTPGQRDALAIAPDFSPASFVTNWNRLSPVGKNLIFGPDTPGSKRAAVEAFVRISQSQKNLGKLANVSGSGSHSNMFWMARDALVALAGAELGTVAGIAGVAAGGYGLGRALLSPAFARFANSSIPAGGGTLSRTIPRAVIGSAFLDERPRVSGQ
jgi:hypothetical protein